VPVTGSPRKTQITCEQISSVALVRACLVQRIFTGILKENIPEERNYVDAFGTKEI